MRGWVDRCRDGGIGEWVGGLAYEHKAQAYTPLGMLKDHAHITVNIFTLYGMFFLILILLFADAVVF